MTATGRLLFLIVVVLSTSACDRSTVDSELKGGVHIAADTRTQCLGRYLVDLPDDFRWGEFPEAEFYYGLDADFKVASAQIIDLHTNEEKFSSRVMERVNAIAAVKNLRTDESMLLERRDLDVDRVLVRRYRSTETDGSQTYEIHQRIGSVHVLLKSTSYPKDTRSAEQILVKLSSQIGLMTRASDQAGPGFCLGPVLVNADSDHEVLINQNALDRTHPDVKFELYMSAVTQDDDERLLNQIDRETSAFDSGPKMLRKARITLGGMEADEALMRFEEDGLVMHSFIARSYRGMPTLATPTIELRLGTGGEISAAPASDPLKYVDDGELPDRSSPRTVSSSLTDNEAMGMWDAVVKSVRLRQGAVPVGK